MAQALLGRRGVESTVVVGLAEGTKPIDSHAWLRIPSYGTVWLDDPSRTVFFEIGPDGELRESFESSRE